MTTISDKPGALGLVTMTLLTLSCAAVGAADAAKALAPSPPAVIPSLPPPLANDPKVTSGVLANGLCYFVRRHQQPQHRAFLMLAVRAGSVLEDEDQRGLAHFVEHMAFNGTRRFQKNELVDFFERSGMQFGADANAFTGVDRTLYMLQLPTDAPELLETGFDVLVDWASALSFDPAQVDQERAVISAEWLRGRGASQRLQEQAQEFLLPGSRYVARRPIGEKSVIDVAPVERIKSFYTDWYRPEEMAVVIVGDVDVEATVRAITSRFAALSAARPARPRPLVAETPGKQARAQVITDAEAQSPGVSVTFKAPAREYLTEADERDRLLDGLVSTMLNQRLAVLAKRPDVPFLSAGTGVVGLSPNTDAYQAQALAKTGQTEAALAALCVELERARRHGFTSGELERAKADIARQRERALAAAETEPSRQYAMRAALAFLDQEALLGPDGEQELARRLLPTITLADVNRTASAWLSIADPAVLLIGPARDTLPDSAALLSTLRTAELSDIAPHVDRLAQGTLLDTEPTPGQVVSEELVPELGLTVWTLSNGARVVLKPTDYKQDELLEQSISSGGSSLATDADYPTAALSTSIVLASGAGSHDTEDLDKLLSGKVVSVQPWMSEHEEGVRGSASPKDTESMLQLMHLYLTAPRRDEAAFVSLRNRQLQAAQNRDLSPMLFFADAMSQKLYGGHLRRQALTVPLIEAINLDTALAFYRDRLGDVGDFTFVFVGKLDPALIKPLIERYLGSVPGTSRADRWRDVGAHLPGGVEQVRVRRGKEPKSQVGLLFHGKAEWSPNAEDDLRMLRAYLDMRLREVIREEKGGSYGVGIAAGISRRPRPEYIVSVGFDCPPTRVDELRSAVFEVIAELKSKGASADAVQKLSETRRRQLETAFRENGFWLEELVEHYKFGTDPRAILELQKTPERVSSGALQRIARRYLDMREYVDALLMPE